MSQLDWLQKQHAGLVLDFFLQAFDSPTPDITAIIESFFQNWFIYFATYIYKKKIFLSFLYRVESLLS